MVWPATSTGERKALWPPLASCLRMRSACVWSCDEKTWMTTAPLGTAGSTISDDFLGRTGVVESPSVAATGVAAGAPFRPLDDGGCGVWTGTAAAWTGDSAGG